MVGTIIGTATAAAAAAVALTGHALGSAPSPVTSSPFGGSVPVHVGHIGHIEVDLGPAGSAKMRQVRCSGAAASTTICFVGR